jgi:Holliday junction resolvasome RuvABC endonuclease subunit
MSFISLGADPGLSNVAIAVAERTASGWHLLDSPVLKSLDEFLSYLAIAREVHCVCVEDLRWTGWAAEGHGKGSDEIKRCVGAAQMLAKIRRVPFVEVLPRVWRNRIAGSGNATKKDVRTVLRRMVSGVPTKFSLNRSDALACAIAGSMVPGLRKTG